MKNINIPPTRVVFDREDRKEILAHIDICLRKGLLSQGQNVKEFEEKWSNYVGAKYAIAVNSGSSAIEISMRILDIKDKEVLVPVNTFVATAVSVLLAGGKIKFVDIDPNTLSINLRSLKNKISKKTVGAIIVHIGGIITPEIKAIKKWCAEKGLWLFEDCAHAHGSALDGQRAGTFGIAGGYSFFATKVITSGEGGMIVTNNSNFADKVRLLRNHGKPKPWVSYYTHIGSNWRMSEINAVIGLAHLKRLNVFIKYREKIALFYTKYLKETPEAKVILPVSRSSWYKYIVVLPKRINRETLKDSLRKKGINLAGEVYEVPLHLQPVFRNYSNERFPLAEDICSRHICLPIYYGMTEKEAKFVVNNLQGEIKKHNS